MAPEPKAAIQKSNFRTYMELMGQFRGRYLFGAALLLVTVLLNCTLPWLLRSLIAQLEAAGASDGRLETVPPGVQQTALVIIATAILMSLVRVGSRITILGGGRKVGVLLSDRCFQSLLDQSPSFFAKYSTGELVSRLTSDVSLCKGVCGPGILYALNALFLYLGSVSFMLYLNWRLTLAILLPMPFLLWAVKRASFRVREHSKNAQEAMAGLTTRVQETLAGMMVIKGFVMEHRERERFAERNQEVLTENVQQSLHRGWVQFYIGLATGLGSLAVLGYGGTLVTQKQLSFADFVAFFGYMGLLIQPTVYLGWVLSTFARGGPALERVLEITEHPRSLKDPEIAHERAVEGRIRFKQFSYRYPRARARDQQQQRRAALIDINIELPKGGRLGLFGRVGSGKSTLLKALPRLLETDPKTVFVDDVPLEQWSQEALREGIGYVPQDGYLFSTTLRANIALGREQVSAEEMTQVLQWAALEKDLDQLDQGLETLLGERGVTLSGGQRQRVAIARALMVKPKILLLDDALSMVDAETSSQILTNLQQAADSLTVVVAAHRTATLLDTDEIIVLEQGRIIERGAPQELLERPGSVFAEAHEHQRLQDSLKDV